MRVNPPAHGEAFDWRSEDGHVLTKNGIWTIAGFVGVNASAIGVMSLIDRNASPAFALAIALVGALLATFAWRSACRVFAGSETAAPQQARPPVDRSTSGLTTLIGAPEA